MQSRKEQIFTAALFCGFLAVMLLLYLVLPKIPFSQQEKRYLAEKPELSWKSLLSGDFGQEMETYLADHIPGRNLFVGLNSAYDLASGRQITKDVRLLPGGRLAEAPVRWNEAQVRKNLSAISAFSENLGQAVDLMIVPSAGWAAQDRAITGLDLFSREQYTDAEIISQIYQLCEGSVRGFDACQVLSGHEEYYYSTDHHWNSQGAYQVYSAYMASLGKDHPSADAFTVETVEDFYGSTYTRSGLWHIPGETLELWHSGSELTVTNAEAGQPHPGVFYRERLAEHDKYTVYLDGNHSLVRIENPAKEGNGKILVIRDSYMNSMGIFLAESYETVVLADLRYYKNPVSQLCRQEDFDTILICYSIGNFMTDTNLIWLR